MNNIRIYKNFNEYPKKFKQMNIQISFFFLQVFLATKIRVGFFNLLVGTCSKNEFFCVFGSKE